MARNVDQQVQTKLEEALALALEAEMERLSVEEAERVNAYTQQWQNHVDAVVKQKNDETDSKMAAQAADYDERIISKDREIDEHREASKKAAVASGVAAVASTAAVVAAELERDNARDSEKEAKKEAKETRKECRQLKGELERKQAELERARSE